MADGSLIFDTKIDSSDFDKDAKKFSPKIIDLKNKIRDTKAEISKLTQELQQMANTPIKTTAMKNLEKEIASAQQKLAELDAQLSQTKGVRVEEVRSMGFSPEEAERAADIALQSDAKYQSAMKSAEEYEARLRSLRAELKRVNDAQSGMTGADTAEYQEKQQKIESLNGRLDLYTAKLHEAENAERSTAAQTSRSSSAADVWRAAVSKGAAAAKSFSRRLTSMLSKMKSVAASTVSKFFNGITSGSHKATHGMGLLDKMTKIISRSFKRVFISGLVLRGMRSILSGIKDGFVGIAKVNPEVNKRLSELSSSFDYLKRSISASFIPIIQASTPYLVRFMDTISDVISKITQLAALFTGNDVFTQAIKQQKDYASSLDETTAAANKIAKAVEDNQRGLAGYDELNVLQDNSADSENADTVSGFVNVSSGEGLFDGVKAAIKNHDYAELGEFFSDKINQALKKIKWKKIKKTVTGWGTNIVSFVNGSVSKLDFSLIGSTIAEGINTAVDFVNTTLGSKGIKFDKIGKKIAEGLSGAIKKLNAINIGLAISNLINSGIHLAGGLFHDFDWTLMGTKIRQSITSFFTNLDAKAAIRGFADLINGIVQSGIALIKDVDFRDLGEKVFSGLKDAFSSIGWGDLFSFLCGLIEGLFEFGDGIVLSIDWSNLGSEVEDSFKTFFGDGGDGYRVIKSMTQFFYDLLLSALTSINSILDAEDWQEQGRQLAEQFRDFDLEKIVGKNSILGNILHTISQILIAALDFIIGFFEDPSTADKVADAIETLLDNIDWEELFIKALTALVNIAGWLVELATDLIVSFCTGLADGFSDSGNESKVTSAIEDFVISFCNTVIGIVENLASIIINGLGNLIFGAVKVLIQLVSAPLAAILGDEWGAGIYDMLYGPDGWGHIDYDTHTLARLQRGENGGITYSWNPPRYATGQVVPAHFGEYLAVLGDNKREPEIVSPLSTMKQAVAEVLSDINRDSDVHVTLYLDRRVVFDEMVATNGEFIKAHGYSAFAKR